MNKWLFIFICLSLSACQEQIIHNLSEGEANRLTAKLHGANIAPQKVRQPDGRWAIAVNDSEALEAIKHLSDARFFRKQSQSLSHRSGFMPSRDDQRFRYERALSQEIESTLTSIQGVLEARVHLNLISTDPLFGKPLRDDEESSGSVLLVTTIKSEIAKEDVAQLVSGASGISAKFISVLIHSAEQREQSQEEVPQPSPSLELSHITALTSNSSVYLGAALLISGAFLVYLGFRQRGWDL